jgi:hypothetical protein
MVSLIIGKADSGSACAPPSGSGTMASITPNLTSSWLVMRSASVAWRGAGSGKRPLSSLGCGCLEAGGRGSARALARLGQWVV